MEDMGVLDRALTRATQPTLAAWHAVGATPNVLTTLGLITSLLSVLALWLGSWWALPAMAARAYFDFADGMLARKYAQTSVFGDWYDHVVDVFGFTIPFVAVLLLKSPSRRAVLTNAALVGGFGAMFSAYMGCLQQQSASAGPSASISWLKRACFSPRLLRVFDNGTFYVLLAALAGVQISGRRSGVGGGKGSLGRAQLGLAVGK